MLADVKSSYIIALECVGGYIMELIATFKLCVSYKMEFIYKNKANGTVQNAKYIT